MKFSLQQLKYVSKVIETGSLSEAAKELSISQAGMSLAIGQLESELGVDLFVRKGRGVVPTEEGERLFFLSNKVLAGAYEIEQEFSHNEADKKRIMNVGAMRHSLIEQPLYRFLQESQSQLKWFGFESERASTIYKEVAGGTKSIGIGYQTQLFENDRKQIMKRTGAEVLGISRIPCEVFLSVDHPLADRESLTPKDLKKYPFFSFDQYMYHWANGRFIGSSGAIEKMGDAFIVHQSTQLTDLIDEVARVNGYTIWAKSGRKAIDPERVRSIPYPSQPPIVFFYVKRHGEQLNELEKKLIACYKEWLES